MTNIRVLFLMGRSGVGGVERVTVVLANELVSRGIPVVVCAFEFEESNFISEMDKRVFVVCLNRNWLSSANCARLRQILVERGVTHIINQWCAPYSVTRFCRKAAKGLGVKQISVHHNLPMTNKRIQDSTGFKRRIWQALTALNLRLVYESSDAYVLLSRSFVDGFSRFIWKRSVPKVCVISNPLTLNSVSRDKENIILYVGRLEETQKRVSRVIEIWRMLSSRLPDWKLVIVGDGPDRAKYEQMTVDISRVEFKGFQDPAEYYARAKVLLLTSDFEGYALVLGEAMASKCVPIVLGSYSAAREIVGDDLVVPMPYVGETFACRVLDLVDDEAKLMKCQERACEAAKKFSVRSITDEWLKLLSEV